MVTFRKIHYSIKENPNRVFSRLDWAVEEVNSIEDQMILKATTETSKSWIGEIKRADLSFTLIEPRERIDLIRRYLPVVVKGKIAGYKSGSIVEVKLRFSLVTSLLILAVYLFSFYKAFHIFIYDLYEQTGGAIIMYAIIPMLLTLLLKVCLDIVEEKIDVLFRD